MLGLRIGFLQRTLELKYKTFKVSGSFLKGQPRKTWNEGMRSDMQEKIRRKDLAKDRNTVQAMQVWKTTDVKANMVMIMMMIMMTNFTNVLLL